MPKEELPIVTVKREGGDYSLDRDPEAPIRIYGDGRIEDDFCEVARGPYSVEELNRIVSCAKRNLKRVSR